VGLSYFSGSLTLLADLAHGAGDTVTYVSAYFAERVKADLSRRSGADAYVAKLDFCAGLTSTLLVAGISLNAMWVASSKLLDSGRRHAAPPEETRLVGPALLTFAVLSLAANIGLLLLRFKGGRGPGPTPSEAAAPSPSIPRTCPPCNSPSRRWAGRQESSQRPQQPQENTASDLVHAMLHPGCDCASSLKGSENARHNNLNLFGATLHLATDVIRSVLVLVVGLLLQIGVFTDTAKTDAVCALIVGVCVLLGTIGFFTLPCTQMHERLPSFASYA